MASRKDAHLYGQRPKSRTKAKEISSSSTIAFSSTLSSLIKSASSDTNRSGTTTAGRPRSKKEDIFTSHNKNVKKRALKDLEESDFTQQKHRGRTAEEKQDDDANWRRMKRRMEEKARLYDALKRGDVEDVDDKYGVDFDRKWAEAQEKGIPEEEIHTSSESEASEEELIEYVDEFGRSRKGTRAEVAREERRKKTLAADEPDRFTARPSMPTNIIYGDAVQSSAFNPDETIAQQMADLAAKRDKTPTPPPDTHFDGKEEMRQRGTGFFHFSKDEEERKAQMARLEKEREDTERAREARKKQVEERKKLVEEKRKKMREKRNVVKADKFLDALGAELFGEASESKTETESKDVEGRSETKDDEA
ncbi:hypothetical protein BU24DRAFT_422481 [Aaosphaeria arxii CBS 175.79]|uniref:DUF4078 domain-containing protein n=1 Tax=Aaosphaeria arxii CBS 175.79 TaxID=1450172 RepID=A0A6A5XTJ3_9PLEO|nr:uncharacterized protein BU24DRAFT_422481 [Aaosphaeria arxii CBS 175.79]KAF2016137.1 hypothetical protein BU24DRAFT_422481 [Aaosphaeria arxii CBS 175.79]